MPNKSAIDRKIEKYTYKLHQYQKMRGGAITKFAVGDKVMIAGSDEFAGRTGTIAKVIQSFDITATMPITDDMIKLSENEKLDAIGPGSTITLKDEYSKIIAPVKVTSVKIFYGIPELSLMAFNETRLTKVENSQHTVNPITSTIQ